MRTRPVVLVAAMIIIKAVLTGCWHAISGQHHIFDMAAWAEALGGEAPGWPLRDHTWQPHHEYDDANFVRLMHAGH